MKVLILLSVFAVTCYAQGQGQFVDVPFTVQTRNGNRNGNSGQPQAQQPRQNFGRNSQPFLQQPQMQQPQNQGQNFGDQQPQWQQPQNRGQNFGAQQPQWQQPQNRGQNFGVQQPQWQQPQNRGQNFGVQQPQWQQPPRRQSRVRGNDAPSQVFLLPFNLDDLQSQNAPATPTRRGGSRRSNNGQGSKIEPIFEIDLSQIQNL